MSCKTRFAPSPTGEIHFGNVRTALFNVLAAINQHGTFLLRVEDTDEERSQEEYEQLLYIDLKWLGLDWQEGSDATTQKGDLGPYKQSQRKEIYDAYYQQLLDNKHAYYCFCSEAQLALSRKLQRSQGLPPRYNGGCDNLSQEEVDARLAQGEVPTVRFRVDKDKVVKFTDVVKGEQEFKGADIGDFIIRRASGTAAFMFCNAIDDSLMKVSLVLRGEDHLTNTPRQIMILEKLKLSGPEYGHINLIVGSDGSPLSKRHGSKSLRRLREEGYLPEAIVNYLARLGHQYTDLGYSSLDTLGKEFNLSNLSSSPARYDEQHLLHWQKEAVLNITSEKFQQWLGDILLDCPAPKRDKFAKMLQENIMFPNEAKQWIDVLFNENGSYSDEQIAIIKDAGADFFETALAYTKENSSNLDIKDLANHLKETLGVGGKKLFMPLRVCLTMASNGPELPTLVDLMGVERVQQRFNKALEII